MNDCHCCYCGALFDGTPVYGDRYKGTPAYHIGLMGLLDYLDPDEFGTSGGLFGRLFPEARAGGDICRSRMSAVVEWAVEWPSRFRR